MNDDRDAKMTELGRCHAVVEHAPDGVVVSRRGTILSLNPAAVAMLGYDHADELIGQSMSLFLDAESLARMRARIAEMQGAGTRLPPLEYAARRRDGTTLTAEIASMVFELDGAPAVVAYARDVTERVRMRAQLEHQDRLAALGLMAAGVAHEINNPLAFMSLAVEMLQRHAARGASAADLAPHLADLASGLERIGAIARDLRVYGKQTDELPAPVPLCEVLDAAERLVAHELRPRVRLRRTHESLPAVLGVARRLEQVFVNLLLNAAIALGEKQDGAEIVVSATVSGPHVEVVVADNGAGMSPDVLARIFEPFFTTRPQGGGTGLGLSICRDIVAGSGGTLVAESVLGEGTTMRVRLPLATRTAASVERAASHAAPARTDARPRVLVVDDEPLLLAHVVRHLSADCDVVGESSPRAAIARMLDGVPFDAVVCDLMMPDLSGIDVYERIAVERPGAESRFVFVTGGAYTPRTRDFLARVPNERLLKPFAPEQLRAAIARIAG